MAVKKPIANLYSMSSDNYDAMMTTKSDIDIFKKVLEEIKNNLNKSGKTLILDLCCGTGILAEMLLDVQDIEFIGVDQNKVFLAKAKERVKNSPNFKIVLEDVLKYKPDLKFDIITLTSSYHHVKDELKTQLLQKIYTLLKEKGVVIVLENRKLFSASQKSNGFL